MIGFYSVRKLIESKKLSSHIVERRIPANAFPWSGKEINFYNRCAIEENYRLDLKQETTVSVKFLCDQFVHSYVHVPVFEWNPKRRLENIIIASDRQRNKHAHEIPVADVISLFVASGTDYPDIMVSRYDEKVGDFDITYENSKQPCDWFSSCQP